MSKIRTPTLTQQALPGSIWEVGPDEAHEPPYLYMIGAKVGSITLQAGRQIQLLEAFMRVHENNDDWFQIALGGDLQKMMYLKNTSLKDDTKFVSTPNRTVSTTYPEADTQLRTKAQMGSKWKLKYDIPVYMPTSTTNPKWNNDWTVHTSIKAGEEVEGWL